MARFSVTDAATSGFGVIRREPLAVLVWGLLVLVVFLLPLIALSWGAMSQFMTFAQAASQAANSDPAMMSQIMRLQSQILGLDLVGALFGVALYAVIGGAVFRIVLEPERKGFFFLRVGAQELWLALLFLTQMVLAYIVLFVATLAVILLTGLSYAIGSSGGSMAGTATAVLVGVIAGLGAFGALIWVGLRLSMAAPLTFTERQFRLFESWDFTRGQSWRLLGMTALVVLIIIGLEMVLYGVLGVGVLAVGGGVFAHLQALESQPPEAWMRLLLPFIAIMGVVGSFVWAGLITLVFAPVATAYRDLRASALSPSLVTPPIEA